MSASHSPEVLIVDDERQLADLYAGWLADAYPVRVAYDGDEALQALDDDVEVVLLDRRMPGLSGDEVLEAVTDQGYGCRVAMVTAVEPDFDIIEMGFDDYLVKPVTYADLKGTVDRLLTRNTYDEQVDEYARLLSKKATLETEKSRQQLAESDRFAELEARIDRLEATVDHMARNFDEDDVAAVLRDLPAGQGA
jgi:DNA-binding response OmpR family regulator